MHFDLTPDQSAIREGTSALCARFDAEYWLAQDRAHAFPHDFYRALADAAQPTRCTERRRPR